MSMFRAKAGRLALVLAVTLIVSGCNKADFRCASQDAENALIEAARKDIAAKVSQNLKDLQELDKSGAAFAPAIIEQMVAKFGFEVSAASDVWENATGDQKSCRARLAVTINPALLKSAGDARTALELSNVADLTAQSAIEYDGTSKLSQEIDFSLNLADAGTKIRSDLGSSFTLFDVLGELGAYNLLSGTIVKTKRDETMRQQLATTEQERAALEMARAENRTAIKAINAVWSAIPSETRSELAALQKAWVRKKNADCRIESLTAGGSEVDMQVNQLNCDTRAQIDRTNWLRSYVTEPSEDIGY